MVGFVVVFFGLLPLLSLYLDHRLGLPSPLTGMDYLLGLILVIPGALLALPCVYQFLTFGKGTPVPLSAPKKFIPSGLYRYTRNPMMWGTWLVFIGQSFFYHSWSLLVITVLVIIPLAIWFVVHIEEPDLEQRFGEEYRDYQKKTPRWGWKF